MPPRRSKDDWAVTVILDSGFAGFLKKNEAVLPGWWKEAIEVKS